MKRRYLLTSFSELKLIEFKFWGTWSLEEFNIFEKIFRQAVDKMSSAGNTFYVLADLSEFPAQSPDIQKKLKENMAYAINKGMIKSARYFKSILNKKQLHDLANQLDSSKFGHFTTREEAYHWLFG